jgi:ATP-binding cassette subfamily F protein uup
MVVEAEGLSKAYEGRPIVRDLAIRIRRGDRLGFVGPNGAGKTTLIKLLTGQLVPDAGRIKIGTNLEIATLEQGRDSLDPDKSLAETLTGGRSDSVMVNGAPRHVVSYMTDFLFAPEQARTPVSALSGGERGRLTLARALARPSNLLVLDEPTNDLDLETLDVLEDILGGYAGTVFLVSHDRDFLDRVVGSVIAPEGDGRWTEYAGGYSDMLAQRGAGRSPARSATPAPPRKQRLSFKDEHALKTLPGEIGKRSAEIARLEAAIPTLPPRPGQVLRTGAALEALRAEVARLEEEWLRIELLRELGQGAT